MSIHTVVAVKNGELSRYVKVRPTLELRQPHFLDSISGIQIYWVEIQRVLQLAVIE